MQAQLSPTTGKLSFAMLGEKLTNPALEIKDQSPQNITAPHFSLKQQPGIIVSYLLALFCIHSGGSRIQSLIHMMHMLE